MGNEPDMIRCLIFDFDGTLVPSNGIKRDSFTESVAEIPGAPEAISRILTRTPDADRYAVFGALAMEFGATVTPSDLVARYGEICKARIVPLIVGSDIPALMQHLSTSGLEVHIATATPYPAIISTLRAAGIAGIFNSVHGRPQTKAEAIREIMLKGAHQPAQVAVIGDGTADRVAAEAAGCHFVAVRPDASDLYGKSVARAVAVLTDKLAPGARLSTAAV
jgi:phosphoglycolate phosphatase